MCRVPMTLDRHNFLPFSLPIWGVAEPTHTHIIPHMNFIFHVMDGFILGASAYPVRDHVEVVMEGGQLNLHGPTRWFQGHTFVPLTLSSQVPTVTSGQGGSAADSGLAAVGLGGNSYLSLALYFFSAFFGTLLLVITLYRFILKPRLIRKHLKQD